MARIKNTLTNMSYAFIGQFVQLIISFFARMVFIQTLGIEYLGLSGLFTSILSMLSLTELGIGSAIIYSLYKPLTEGDREKIKSLMALFKKAYTIIGCIILTLGISLTPFLGLLITELPDISHIRLIYMMFVVNLGISYFVTYKRSLIIANQKRYIVTLYHHIAFLGLNVAQIAVLLTTQNYLLFLTLMIAGTLVENLMISAKANRMFPLLREKTTAQLEKTEKDMIFRNVFALTAHKIGGVVVNGMDSIFLGIYAGIATVGLYANYLLITNALHSLFGHIAESITASIGHLGVSGSDEKKLWVFNVLNFALFWICGFASICLITLFNPFITLWLGEEFLLDIYMVTAIVFYFYLCGMRYSVGAYRNALGVFWFDRYRPLAQAIVKLGLSIWLGSQWGAIGVLLGSIVSTVATCFWVEPYVLYKHGLHMRISPYFLRYLCYTVICIGAGVVTYGAVFVIAIEGVFGFILKALICVIIPNAVFFMIFRKSKEFQYLYKVVMKQGKKRPWG